VSEPCSDYKPNESVTYHYKKFGSVTRPVKAVVIKSKPKFVRIKALMNGHVWEFKDVLPDEIERVGVK